ncbi:MAG TPA: STAS domain-containing protein [Verrucomicrobiae bacterium]|nr:STAS domain-containing protein [Verrucomicrobiae bacterium]
MLLNIVERKVEPDLTVVEVSGRLALGRESQRIETLAEEMGQKGVRRLVLDLTGVDYIDSAGIGVLALAAGKFKEAGGTLAIVAPEGRVLQLLNLTQISAVVKVCPTVEAAAKAVS